MTHLQCLFVVLVAGAATCGHAQILPDATVQAELPPDLADCISRLSNKTSDTAAFLPSPEEAHMHCLQEFIWRTDQVNWDQFNVTAKDVDFISSLIKSIFASPKGKSRSKRQTNRGGIFPPTGFRIRREYRRLSDGERFAYHAALNQMKMNGQYDTFANLHQGIVITSAHEGPNFFGWHRVYLSLFEEALRRINRRLSLPYWDSSLDFDMENPVNSILFSPPFLGNGDGFVTSGPFANWQTPSGPLTRNIAEASRLLSKEVIQMILTRCRTREISDPTAQPQFNLEIAHGGPHVWIGGQMAGLNTAAHDPVFFMHHAFIDYIWELFRIRQFRFCGVNPSRDYPPTMGQHAPTRAMDGLPGYRNIDGYRSYWTRFWYRYERSPRCSMRRPYCGTPYLTCDRMRGRCISVARMLAPDEGAPALGAAAAFSATGRAASPRSSRARLQAASIDVGPRFRAPPAEPRTQAAQLSLMRVRRALPEGNQTETSIAKSKGGFTAPPSDGRTSDAMGFNIASGVPGGHDRVIDARNNGHVFPVSEPMEVLPPTVNTDQRLPDNFTTYDNSKNGNVSEWLFVPVLVKYHDSSQSTRPNTYSILRPRQSDACFYEHTEVHVKVQSQGLNYLGAYTDYLIFESNLPASTSPGFVAVRAPNVGPSEAMVTATHGCGHMCLPTCLVPDSKPALYQPCAGILKLMPIDVAKFRKSYDDASATYERGRNGLDRPEQDPPIVFHCSPRSYSPWASPGRHVVAGL
ncbi:tyrosinase-like protein [Mya arenaria]|uniref:tyrosinase-like protein n=1 Tax=Mya arenaria TaxID=6604 RepID=UPI0022E39129|nr:tyrosinase-like protein [Mya arenaria]